MGQRPDEGNVHEHCSRARSPTGSRARLKAAYPELPDAPTPDMLDHDRITAYLKPVHDVGGEPDAPMKYENKQYELWEHMTYVICEVLGWRGIWLSEERRRMGNVDVGRAEYLGLPYYGRWLLAVARVLVEKHHIGLTELSERMVEVKERYAGGLDGKKLEAQPKSEGDGSQVKRNTPSSTPTARATRRCYAGQAGPAEVQGRRPGRGARTSGGLLHPHARVRPRRDRRNRGGGIRKPRRRGRDLGPSRAQPEWFYVVKFNMAELWYGYTGTARRRHLDRDPRTLAAGRQLACARKGIRMADARPRSRSRSHRRADGRRDHRLRSPRDRAARTVHREGHLHRRGAPPA